MTRTERIAALKAAAKERMLILDGSWGVMIQKRGLAEADYRGDRFKDHPRPAEGQQRHPVPDPAGHRRRAARRLLRRRRRHQRDQHLLGHLHRPGRLRARRPRCATSTWQAPGIAREVADRWTAKEPHKPRFVAGSIGPAAGDAVDELRRERSRARGRSPSSRSTRPIAEQVRALHEGGVDLFLIETITDTLNCKAAIKAILDLEDEGYEPLPIWISGTITDRSGRTLSGQTVEAFWNSVRHAKPFAVGLNCALGAELMRPHIAELARIADTLVSAYPNAGLPNAMGEYDETPRRDRPHAARLGRAGHRQHPGRLLRDDARPHQATWPTRCAG